MLGAAKVERRRSVKAARQWWKLHRFEQQRSAGFGSGVTGADLGARKYGRRLKAKGRQRLAGGARLLDAALAELAIVIVARTVRFGVAVPQ